MDATICTVLTPFHKRLAGLNYSLVEAHNPGAQIAWSIAYNPELHLSKENRKRLMRSIRIRRGLPDNWPARGQEDEAKAFIQEELMAAADPGEVQDYVPAARVLKGYSEKELLAEFAQLFQITQEVAFKAAKYAASYLHAASLYRAVKAAKTRFVIIMDPDLYVVRDRWVRDIILRMKKRDLAVFGVPWNPRWHHKFRDFPCTHLMVIDRKKLDVEEGFFSPDFLHTEVKFAAKTIQAYLELKAHKRTTPEQVRAARQELLTKIPQVIREDRMQRRSIGHSRDTGYAVRDKLRQSPQLKFEAATPVFDPRIDPFQPNSVHPWQRSKWCEAMFPRDQRYMPERSQYSPTGFLERGFPNFRSLNWEEFLLDDEPFAFHIRGELHRPKQLAVDPYPAWFGLNTILERGGAPSLRWPDPPTLEATAQERTATSVGRDL